jgi:hypothetical protein
MLTEYAGTDDYITILYVDLNDLSNDPARNMGFADSLDAAVDILV